MKKKNLIIVGDSAFAEIAYEYFTNDSDFNVACFAVEKQFKKKELFNNLNVYNLEDLPKYFAPGDFFFHVAVTYGNLNYLRLRLIDKLKSFGFLPASYVSTKCFIWPNVRLGEHVFIFENNTIQPFVEIGNNVVIWSGNHIGHHSKICDNVFVSSHVVLSGFCEIGSNVFLGVNSTVVNNTKIGKDTWVGPGCVVDKCIPENMVLKCPKSELLDLSARFIFQAPQQ